MLTRKSFAGKSLLYWVTLVAIIVGLALAATPGAASKSTRDQLSQETLLVPEELPPGVPA